MLKLQLSMDLPLIDRYTES